MKHFFKSALGAFVGTLLALFALVFIIVGLLGTAFSSAESSEPVIPKEAVLMLDFKKPLGEQSRESFNIDPFSGSADMTKSLSLLKAVQAIDAAAADPGVKFVYLKLDPSSLNITMSQMEEIHAALERLHASGKPVVAYATDLSSPILYLASSADKLILNNHATCMVEGLSTTVMFYKDLIDKLGIDVQLIRHGKYKSAGEPYIKNNISPENKEQYQVMLTTIWNTWAEAIAASRGCTVEQLNEWVDNIAILDPETAKEKGLVDELWYPDEVAAYLCGLFGVEKEKELKVVGLSEYADAKVKANFRAKDKIAVIYADGQIAMDDSSDGVIGAHFASEIQKAREDSTVKAVVFRVNSPGGEVGASERIRREISLLKECKPVIASYGDYAASGGYWISAGCDKIFADRTTLTGSIGIFGLLPSFGRAAKQNLSINFATVTTHKHSQLGSIFETLDEQQLAYMQNMIENGYEEFTGIVSRARNMSVSAVDSIAQGRVWAGGDAINIGLIDQIGTLQDALNYAAVVSGITDYQLVEYPAVTSFYDKLMKSLSGAEASAKVPVPVMDAAAQWIQNISEPKVVAQMDQLTIVW